MKIIIMKMATIPSTQLLLQSRLLDSNVAYLLYHIDYQYNNSSMLIWCCVTRAVCLFLLLNTTNPRSSSLIYIVQHVLQYTLRNITFIYFLFSTIAVEKLNLKKIAASRQCIHGYIPPCAL